MSVGLSDIVITNQGCSFFAIKFGFYLDMY